MRKLFIIFAVTMLTASCYQEYDVPIPKEERDYLPTPTRAGIVLNLNDSLMVLGPQLENPYTIATMEEARAQLLEENPDLNIPEITTSHYYVRFAPANDEELHTLLQDTTLHFYDFPLDREIFSGVYYHDPAIADSLPTYQYVSIPAEQWSREYANHEIAHEILESLCIPEDMDDFFDGDSNPGWGGGTITPIDPVDPWIPSPGTGEVGPLNTSLSQEDIIDMLVDRALSITGNLDSNSGTTTQSVANTNSSSNESWTPGGRITVYDDIVGDQIPLEGITVSARRWFTTHTGVTDSNGNFVCSNSFKHAANYSIKWKDEKWNICNGSNSQVYYNGPKIKGSWTLNITNSEPKKLAHATIHRALYRISYKSNNGLSNPINDQPTRVLYLHRYKKEFEGWSKKTEDGYYKIKIVGKDKYSTPKVPSTLFSIVCHEYGGHVAHMSNCSSYSSLPLRYIEAWAIFTQFYLTYIEYQQLNQLANLNVYSNERQIITADEIYNFQKWHTFLYSIDEIRHEYPPIFVDIYDNYNQYTSSSDPGACYCVNDGICYNNALSIQFMVFTSSSFRQIKQKFINTYNMNPNLYNFRMDDINRLFDYYEY